MTQSPLHEAARSARVQAVQDLLRQGAPVDALDGFGSTPLADVLLTYSLIQQGGVTFTTPDHQAVAERRLATIWALLRDHGASMELALQAAEPLTPVTGAWVARLEAERARLLMEASTAKAAGMRPIARL
eukprot:GHVU01009393.1.p2 GENE.GHVU01009393.1~~GHVU01009393.1.p2  ORF type:complete len:130 (+),score=11.09 GHVU01009393.1:114-503(+)